MSGVPPGFATDEDVHGDVAAGLRRRGLDAVSMPEAGRLAAQDEEQLARAAGEDRVPITFNVADFARLHHEWSAAGRAHAGLVVSRQRPIGEVVRAVERLAASLDRDAMRDRLEYLSHWLT